MLKQVLFVLLAISTINSCGLFADKMCLSCLVNVCLVCDGGYPTTTGCKTPSTAIANCLTYTNATTCSACKGGYSSKDNKTCTALTTENCYAGVLDVCTTCKSGKKYDTATKKCTDTACTAANCAYCSVIGTAETCTECNSGYELGGITSLSCTKVDTHCALRTILGCTMCEQGYYMKGDDCLSGGSSYVQKLGFVAFFAFLLM